MDNDQVQGQSIEERIQAATQEPDPTPEPAVEDVKKQPEPTPSSDQNPTEVKEEAPPAPVPEGSDPVDDETEALANSKNPERTKAYIEKLKTQLKEAQSVKATPPQVEPSPAEYGTSVFDMFHPAQAEPMPHVQSAQTNYLPPQQVQDIKAQFIDAEGNVDIDGVNRALHQANQEAREAKLEAQRLNDRIVRFEESQQAQTLHKEHPELDPKNGEKFDPQLYKLMRAQLLANMYEGKQEDPVKVAADLKKLYQPQTKPVSEANIAEKAVEEYKLTQEARRQGPLESGRGQDRNPDISLDELRAKTRQGDDQALSLRLKAIGI